MPPLNYTTTVAVGKTVGEVQQILVEHGADAVVVRYSAKQPVGISFQLPTPHGDRAFTLPVDIDAVHGLLKREHEAGRLRNSKLRVDERASREQAARVAWRVAKDWLEAQLAMVQARMATFDQIMLPYLHVNGDQTLYQAYQEREQAALTAGGT